MPEDNVPQAAEPVATAPEEKTEEVVEEKDGFEEAPPWTTEKKTEGEEPEEEEIDISQALANARAEYERGGVRGKDPVQDKIAALEEEIAALKQGGGPKPKVQLSENATVDELMAVVDQLVEEKVKGFYKMTETEKQREENNKRMLISQQDQEIERHLDVLRKNKIAATPEDEKAILKTCVEYGIVDIFKGAEIWDAKRKLSGLNDRSKNQQVVTQKKEIMSKLGKSNPITSSKPKMDIRRMSLDDIAAAAAKR